jgi:hypothetical protein
MVAYGNVRSDVVFAGEKHPDHDPDEDESDGEVALDLKGRRHVDTSDRGRDAYWINVKTSSAYTTFPMPGGASSIALRRFLANRLPPELIVDEYGAVTPIDDIRADHLPSLQAQVWRLGPKGHTHTSPRSAYSGFPTRDYEELGKQLVTAMAPAAQQALEKKEALLLATHATFITKLLDGKQHFCISVSLQYTKKIGNHIFIIHDGKTSACELPTCPTPSNDQLSPPTMLAIEPLIHWGTVTAVTEKLTCRALVQAFRRDGEMCSDLLWTLAMKRFTPEHPTTYCENCLELLMDKRIEAWELAKRHETLRFTAVNVRIDLAPRVGHIHVSEEREEVDTGSGTCKGVVRASPEGLGSSIQQFPVRNAGGTDDMVRSNPLFSLVCQRSYYVNNDLGISATRRRLRSAGHFPPPRCPRLKERGQNTSESSGYYGYRYARSSRIVWFRCSLTWAFCCELHSSSSSIHIFRDLYRRQRL